MKPRRFLLTAAVFIAGFSASAQDTIQFTWQRVEGGPADNVCFEIIATAGKQFIVDWGAGYNYEDWPITGTGNWQYLSYYYQDSEEYTVTITSKTPDCFITGLGHNIDFNTLNVSRCPSLEYLEVYGTFTELDITKNKALIVFCGVSRNVLDLDLSKNTAMQYFYSGLNLLDLDLSKNTALIELDCSNNQLKTLLLNKNTVLNYLACRGNHLPLSELYAAFKKLKDTMTIIQDHEMYAAKLGTQTLEPMEVTLGNAVDLSAQATFGGIATNFKVEKNGKKAAYKITKSGIITISDTGKHIITMTNAALVSEPRFSAKVILEINMVPDTSDAIIEPEQETIKIFPNPTTGQLRITNYELRENSIVEIYDIYGKKLLSLPSLLSPETFPSFGEAGVVLDISHLTNGIYILKLNNNKIIKIIKIIKF